MLLKLLKVFRALLSHKRLPQNVWPSKKKSQKMFSNPTKYSGHYFPNKRPPQNVWSQQQGAGQIYHHTHLYERRTNAIKLPSRWGLTMCWRSPRTTLWRWRDAAGSLRRNRSGGLKLSVLFFGFFFESFFHAKTKASSLLLLLEGCMLSHFFCKIGSEAAGATSFLRIDLADCAADQFS